MSEGILPGTAKPVGGLLTPTTVAPGVAVSVSNVAAAANSSGTVAAPTSGQNSNGSNTVAQAASQAEPDMKGWLLKWTNYLKGYQKRWFVLSKGVLSYYR